LTCCHKMETCSLRQTGCEAEEYDRKCPNAKPKLFYSKDGMGD